MMLKVNYTSIELKQKKLRGKVREAFSKHERDLKHMSSDILKSQGISTLRSQRRNNNCRENYHE